MSLLFKAGDKVYCPLKGTGIYRVMRGDEPYHPLYLADLSYRFTVEGVAKESGLPQFFHATQENQKMLEQLYGFVFVDAPKTGSDLTRQMFNESSKPILCYVSDTSDYQAVQNNRPVLVIGLTVGGGFIIHSKDVCNYAVPYEHAVRTLEDVT
jgi:hypothetical protein